MCCLPIYAVGIATTAANERAGIVGSGGIFESGDRRISTTAATEMARAMPLQKGHVRARNINISCGMLSKFGRPPYKFHLHGYYRTDQIVHLCIELSNRHRVPSLVARFFEKENQEIEGGTFPN